MFANEDFGYRKVTVERPLRLNFAATEERIARIEDERAFQNLAKSKKRPGPAHDAEVAEGQARQEAIRDLLRSLAGQTGGAVVRDRETFVEVLRGAEAAARVKLAAPERKAVLAALGERDPAADVCRDRRGNPEPDTELRDTETVPLAEEVDAYIAREVLPHVPDGWVDESKTKGRLRDPAQPSLLRVRAASPARGDRGGPAGAGAGDSGPALRCREKLMHYRFLPGCVR